MMIMTWHSEWW